MRNIYLTERTAADIDKQVSKILRGLGNPTTPIDLEAVYTLQRLDAQYYNKSDDGVMRETISRVKVGVKLFFEDPTRIWDAVKKADLKALYIPTQRKILIDGDLHVMKKRWNGAHEIGHSILDWHQDYTWGDTQTTLSQACHEQLEAEANYAAGRLLFKQEQFDGHVKGEKHTLKGIGKIAKAFGNSWTSTLYRTVETLDVPAFAVIGAHPLIGVDDKYRYFVASPSFLNHFPSFSEGDMDNIFPTYCGYLTKGPVGEGTFELTDARSERHAFVIESFALPYGEVLTLAQSTGRVTRLLSVGASS